MKHIFTLLAINAFLCSFAQQASQQWLNRYNGIGNFSDKFNCTATDASGNIYAAGFSVIAGDRKDYLLVKYDATGTLVWSKTKDGVGSKDDEILAMTIDGSGNVYVTGYSKGSTTNDDIVTVKYDASGNEVWVATYDNTTSNDDDQGNSIALDAQGNVIVAGQTDTDPSATSNDDYVVIKYTNAGVQSWAMTYDGTGAGKDRALKVATNAANEIIVTGRSDNGSDDDIVTRKYTATGTVSWTKTVNNGMDDRPADLKIDASSNIYIAGFSNNGNDDDYIVLKYATNGTASWNASGVIYDGVNNLDDRAFSLVVDGSGNCYVTGRSDSDPNATNYDFCTIKVTSAGAISWNKTYNGTGAGTDEANSICLLSNGNVVVSGKSDSDVSTTTADYNVVSICYNASGTQVWSQTFSGVSDDVPAYNQVDGSGNVIVCGYTTDNQGFSDGLVVKYSASGTQSWNKSFKGLGDNSDNANAITTDSQGNTYVAGYTYSKDMRDMLIMKINSVGDTIWTKTYNGTANGMDEATSIQVDGSGNVYVTGFTKETLSDYDVTTIKFNASGVIQWTTQFDNTSVNGEDKGTKLLVDASGYVYVAAYTDMDATTATDKDLIVIKYNATGVQQWIKQYSGVGDDEPVDLEFAGTNIAVTGKTTNATDVDMVTIVYNPSGTQQWQKIYASVSGTNDVVYDMTTDNSGNVYITGKSDDGVNSDAVTIAYSSSGTQTWLHTYTSGSNREKGVSIALTSIGGVAITGTSNDGTQNDIIIVAISSTGSTSWQATFDGGNSLDDVSSVILKDANGDFIITGKTDVAGATVTHSNLLLRKYGATGNLIWSVTYDNNIEGNDVGNAMALTNANEIIVAGYSQSTLGQKDLVTIKYNNPGTGAGIDEIKYPNNLYVYPNPMTETATFSNLEELKGNKTLSIFQMDGRCVRSETLDENGTFNKGTLRAGTYIFNVSTEEKTISGKFVIE